MRSAKQAGTRFESQVAEYLGSRLEGSVERRRLCGANDKGDLSGVAAHGMQVAVECKDHAKMELAAWVEEAERERENARADLGVVVHKRRGCADPARQYVTMTLGTFAALAGGQVSE